MASGLMSSMLIVSPVVLSRPEASTTAGSSVSAQNLASRPGSWESTIKAPIRSPWQHRRQCDRSRRQVVPFSGGQPQGFCRFPHQQSVLEFFVRCDFLAWRNNGSLCVSHRVVGCHRLSPAVSDPQRAARRRRQADRPPDRANRSRAPSRRPALRGHRRLALLPAAAVGVHRHQPRRGPRHRHEGPRIVPHLPGRRDRPARPDHWTSRCCAKRARCTSSDTRTSRIGSRRAGAFGIIQPLAGFLTP